MVIHGDFETSEPATDRITKWKQAFFRSEVQFIAYIGLLIFVGFLADAWQPAAWLLTALIFGLYVAGVVGFVMLAALTPVPTSRHPKILFVRLRQLFKGIWAAIMLVLTALLGATMSADLQRYGVENPSGFFFDVFIPHYLSFVVELAIWGGLFIYMILTATDLLAAGDAALVEARHRGMTHLTAFLGYDKETQWPYGIHLLGSVWRNLTGGPVRLFFIGYLITPVLGIPTYAAIDQLVP